MRPLEKITLWNRYGYAAAQGDWAVEDVKADDEDERQEFEFGRELLDQFEEKFEFLGNKFLSDPKEAFYQGIEFMTVWRRKSDGKCFGFSYWEMGGKYGEAFIEGNGDSHGIDWQDPRGQAFVFVEVEPFTITGYRFDV